ncbi:uracil-DNA glycosylase [Corynebacterium propinquum]|uniref:uracil-DNA glycosylase n=1 Tax=Corynebacterium propinquum TaxID=43769 RepID=UPI003D6CB79D
MTDPISDSVTDPDTASNHLAQKLSAWPGLLTRVDESWYPVLATVADEISAAMSYASQGDYLPAEDDVFRALSLPLEKVRVLIVGQDPYPTPGHAMGLSFSTHPAATGAPPRSLANIYQELAADTCHAVTADGDLRPWHEQGVLLLNRVLTVAPGQAGSHRKQGWEAVTEAILRALPEQNLVAILWGKQAQECEKFLDCPAITSPHPSPLSARRGFFGSRPFSRANQYLIDQGCQPIDWQL